jgi:hypothetical protein
MGLFEQTTLAEQAARDNEAMQIAKLPAGRAPVYYAAQAAGDLGRGVGGLFGIKSKAEELALKKDKVRETIFNALPDDLATNPKTMYKGATMLLRAGETEMAHKMMEAARKLTEAQKTTVGKSTDTQMWLSMRLTQCPAGDTACQQKVYDDYDAMMMGGKKTAGTEMERRFAARRSGCNNDELCLDTVNKDETAYYKRKIEGDKSEDKKWKHDIAAKTNSVRTAAIEMGVPLTESQIEYIVTNSKDSLVFSPTTGQVVDTVKVLINGYRDSYGDGGEAGGDSGFISTPASLHIAEQTKYRKEQDADKKKLDAERLEIARRAEKRANDALKVGDKRYTGGRVTDLSESLTKTGIPPLEANLSRMEDLIVQHNGNLPGINIAEQFSQSSEAKEVKSALASLVNTIRHAKFGSVLTAGEIDALNQEIQGTALPTDSDITRWVGRLRKVIETEKGNIFAGYGDNVTRLYWGRSGAVQYKTPTSNKKDGGGSGKVSASKIRSDAVKYGWTSEQLNNALIKYGEE